MSKRLTRKEIKEQVRHDDLQDAVVSTYDIVRENRGVIITAAVALVVIAVGVAAYLAHVESRNTESSQQLAAAIKIVEAPIQEEGARPDDPEAPSFASAETRRAAARQALEEVGGGPAGEVAQLYLADIALAEGDSESARKIWQSFLEDNEDHLLTVAVRRNLIELDRQEGKAQEVADRLLQELDAPRKTLPEDLLLYELAQTLEALERDDEAREYYQRILDDHPTSPFSSPASQKVS